MNRSQQWNGVPQLIDQLIETADVGHRDRILLEAVTRQPWIEAAALWRPASDGPEFGARWHQVLARGRADRLPEREAIQAVARGDCAGDVYPGLRLWKAGAGRGAFVLAVAYEAATDEDCDLLETLVCLFAAVDAGENEDAADHDLDLWAPLVPADDDGRMEHDLRNLLTGIQATQELLASYGEDLSDEETKRFASLIDTECTRAGDLLGHVLAGGEPKDLCRPAAVLRDVVAQLAAEDGIPVHLALDGAARELASDVDSSALHAALHALLREQGMHGTRISLTLRASEGRTAHLVMHNEAEGDAPVPDGVRISDVERLGVEVSRDADGGWLLAFPARP